MASKVLSAVALLVSLAAMGITLHGRYLVESPLGRGMDHYDFTSPEKAFRSTLEMDLNSDIRAAREVHELFKGAEIREKLETLSIEKTREYAGKKILYVKWASGGTERYEYVVFEKDADSALWERILISAWDVDDEPLADDMRAWEGRNQE